MVRQFAFIRLLLANLFKMFVVFQPVNHVFRHAVAVAGSHRQPLIVSSNDEEMDSSQHDLTTTAVTEQLTACQ